jgi:DNA-binding HxlR family transcriptional regulator
MDRKAWVMRAVEVLRYATFKDIERYLEDEGEPFSRKELLDTLRALVEEGRLEEKEGTYRLAPKKGRSEAFHKLFGD